MAPATSLSQPPAIRIAYTQTEIASAAQSVLFCSLTSHVFLSCNARNDSLDEWLQQAKYTVRIPRDGDSGNAAFPSEVLKIEKEAAEGFL